MGKFETYIELYDYITTLPAGVRWAGLTFGSLITALSLLGNTLLIFVITMDIRLRTRTNMYLVSMAISEIITMLGKDIFVLVTYTKGYWPFNGQVLFVTFIMDRLKYTLAIEHISIITVYRYIMIVHNKYYRHISDKKCVICIMILVYIAPIGIYVANKRNELKQDLDLVLVFNMKYMQVTSLEDFVNFGHTINNDTVSSNVTENTFLQLAEQQIPSSRISNNKIYIVFLLAGVGLVLLVMYLHIYMFTRHHAHKLSAWTNQDNHERKKSDRLSKKQSHEVRLIRTMGLVFIGYTFTYTLLPIVKMFDKSGDMPHGVLLPFNILTWSSLCINWITYVLTNSQIKLGFKKLLTGKSIRVKAMDHSHTNADESQMG